MMNSKHSLIAHLQQLLNTKIHDLQEAVSSAKESRDSDTKSSAGDKHETSREIAQVEIEKLELQLHKTQILQQELNSIDPDKKNETAVVGSVVVTNTGRYFISIPYGKITLDKVDYYAISLQSPIGEAIKFKAPGDKVSFMGKDFMIEEVL